MVQPTITESPDRQPSARDTDQFNQNATTEARLNELRSSRSETSEETPPSQESSQENLNPEQIENKLGAQKAEQNKPSATDQTKDAIVDLATKQVKKTVFMALLPWLPWIIGIPIASFMICFIGFAMASVYTCVQEKGVIGNVWDYVFRDGFTTTLKDSFNGTCGLLKNTAPKTITEETKTPESSNVGATQKTPTQ